MVEVSRRDLRIYDEVSLELSLAQLKYLNPLSLLAFIGITMVSATVASPTEAEISDQYLTILTPVSQMIAGYWGVLILLLIGQCILTTITTSRETKELLVNGIGKKLALVNLSMFFWTISWTLKRFLLAEIFLFVAGILSLSILIGVQPFTASITSSPISFIFIHAPARMLFVIIFSCDIFQNGLMALGWYKYVGPLLDIPHGHWESDHALHSWIATLIVVTVAAINSYIVFTSTDLIWAASSIYLGIALSLKSEYKPVQVIIALIAGSSLVLLSLLGSIGYKYFSSKNERDRLQIEEERRALLD